MRRGVQHKRLLTGRYTEIGDHLTYQLAGIDAGELEILAAPIVNASQIQQFVDDRDHQPALPVDDAQKLALLFLAEALCHHDLGIAVDARHRRAKFVRGVRQELAFHAIDFGFVRHFTEIEDLRDCLSRRQAQAEFQHMIARSCQFDQLALAFHRWQGRLANARRVAGAKLALEFRKIRESTWIQAALGQSRGKNGLIKPDDLCRIQPCHAEKGRIGVLDVTLGVKGDKTIRAQIKDGVELLRAVLQGSGHACCLFVGAGQLFHALGNGARHDIESCTQATHVVETLRYRCRR